MTARGVSRWAAAVVGVVLIAGCGDPVLWARYRAERDFWKAGRETERIRVNPRLAKDEDFARAARSFGRVADAFPADRWATPAALAHPYGKDIAMLSGRARVAALRFDRSHGGSGSPEEYARIADEYAAVPLVRREALTALARSLQRADRHAEAAVAWLAIWNESGSVDAGREQVEETVLEAPFGAARSLRLSGRNVAADSLLESARKRFTAEAEQWRGRRPAAPLWRRAADAGLQAGNHAGASTALRGALGEAESKDAAGQIVLSLARRHLQARQPDSALVYTAWAARDFGSNERSTALLVAASAWEAIGQPDSALAGLKRLLISAKIGSETWVRGRFGHAEVLERMGRWEQARGEYRTLVAGAPSHALGLRAQAAIVRHHAAAGETALARIEGRRTIESVDRVLKISQDDSAQVVGRRCRGEVLEALGDVVGAAAAYADLWHRYPGSAEAAWAGWRAAMLAERRGDRERAVTLYRELAEAVEPELRGDADRALRRLGVDVMSKR